MRAKRRLPAWSLPLALVVLAGAAWAVRRPSASRPAVPDAAARAEAVRALARDPRGALQRKAAESARLDPGYRRSLLAVDRDFVRTLPGFSEAEKESLWQLVRAAQEGVRRDEVSNR